MARRIEVSEDDFRALFNWVALTEQTCGKLADEYDERLRATTASSQETSEEDARRAALLRSLSSQATQFLGLMNEKLSGGAREG